MKKSVISLATVILCGSFYVQAQTGGGMPSNRPSTTPSSGPSTTPSSGPSSMPGMSPAIASLNNDTLLNYIHHLNNEEVSAANTALDQLTNQQARDFAQSMVTEHSQNELQVVQLSSQKGLPLYGYQPSTVDIAIDSQLQTLSGPTYDLAYLNTQLTGHQKALQDLKLLQSQVTDPDLQNLTNQSITAIQKHIDMANAAINGLSAGSTSSPTPSSTPQV
jgi:putative membrane protein